MTIVTEAQIQSYINEIKVLPPNFSPNLRDKCVNSQSHEHFECEIRGADDNIFKIIVKQSKNNILDFSIIFGVMISGKVFRLKRYNGNHGTHCNTIERQWFDGCHIHKATERYQEIGFREEHYAET